MSREMQVSDSVVIHADARTIYDQVADPTQMPRWSPENTGATTQAAQGDAQGPLEKGAVFDGSNKRGLARWRTECVVTAAEPGRRFAFRVRKIGPRTPFIPAPIASWEYTFEPAGKGTRVTETWTDLRRVWPDWAAAILDKAATGGRSFSDYQRGNIARTLARMKLDFEGQMEEKS